MCVYQKEYLSRLRQGWCRYVFTWCLCQTCAFARVNAKHVFTCIYLYICIIHIACICMWMQNIYIVFDNKKIFMSLLCVSLYLVFYIKRHLEGNVDYDAWSRQLIWNSSHRSLLDTILFVSSYRQRPLRFHACSACRLYMQEREPLHQITRDFTVRFKKGLPDMVLGYTRHSEQA